MDTRLGEYLQHILTARVYNVAIETPLETRGQTLALARHHAESNVV